MLLSPLALTGEIKSLLLTHNSWFIHEILPLIFDEQVEITQKAPSPTQLFQHMRFKLWMDNGASYPTSALEIQNILTSKTIKTN